MFVFRNFKQNLEEALKNIMFFENEKDFYKYVLDFAKENYYYLSKAKLKDIKLTDASCFFGLGFGKNSLFVKVNNKTIGICKHYTSIEEYKKEKDVFEKIKTMQ